MYGQQFLAMWAQADLSEVKALWAEKLGGFTADHLAAALKACDEKRYPPNLPEFIALCRDQARRDGTGVLRLVAPGPDGATRAARREQTRKMIERLAWKMGHED